MENLDICNMTSSQVLVLPYIVITHSAAPLISQLQGQSLTTPIIYTHPIGEQQHRNQSHIQPIGIQQAFPPELLQLSVCKEELPLEQQEWSPSLSQEGLEPPHIKEEEKEFPVKKEHDEECAQWSQLHQRQSEENREAEPVASTSTEEMEAEVVEVEVEVDPEDPAAALEPSGAEQFLCSHCSEPETEDSDGCWKKTTEPPSELQQLSVYKEKLPPEQQDWSTSLGQEEPEPLHIKEEEEEFPVKREHGEVCAQWSQLHQSQTGEKREAEPVASTSTEQMESEADGEDRGVSEAASSSDPAAAFEPAGAEQLFFSHSSETETEDSDEDCKETREPQSGYHRKCHPTQRGKKLYDCEQCGKRFSTRAEVKVHLRMHTGDKPFPCEQCGKRFSRSASLKIHQRTHTGDKPYHCDQCERRFSLLHHLKKHQLTHTGEKPYQCEQCGKSFMTSCYLKVHQRTHTGEKPYHCDKCGKRFKQSAKLIIHQRTHTGEKLYHCEQCGRRFSQSPNLKSHQRTHTREKPYHCEQCGKRFTTRSAVKRHKRTHTGEKPYPCEQCGKRFSQSTNLKIHQRTHCTESLFT